MNVRETEGIVWVLKHIKTHFAGKGDKKGDESKYIAKGL